MLNQGALFLGGHTKIYFVQLERKEWRTLSEKALCKYCSFYVLKSCIFFFERELSVLDCLLSLFHWKTSRYGLVWLRMLEYSVSMVFLTAELFRILSVVI